MPGDVVSIPLTSLPGALRERFGLAASYQRCWALAVSAAFPSHRDGRRVMIAVADLPQVAAVLGDALGVPASRSRAA